MRFCVLLGSGVSRPASLPSVNDLTSQVLVSEDFFRDSDEIYRRVSTVQPSTQLVQIQMPEMDRIKQFLRWFKGHAELRYAADNTRQVNYEDLAYLAAQIHDDAFNNLNGYLWVPTPDEVIVMPAGSLSGFGLFFPVAPSVTVWNAGLVFAER